MLVGMQLRIGKVFTTTGPFGFVGSISSTVPRVRSVGEALAFVTRKCPVLGLKADPPIPAIATAPKQGLEGLAWLAQYVPSGLICGPWWHGLSGPRIFTPAPCPVTPESARVDGSGQGNARGDPPFGPTSSTTTPVLFAAALS